MATVTRRALGHPRPTVLVLLHFSQPVAGARHYVDRAADVDAHLARLRSGRVGPPIIRAAVAAGVVLEVAPPSCLTCRAVSGRAR